MMFNRVPIHCHLCEGLMNASKVLYSFSMICDHAIFKLNYDDNRVRISSVLISYYVQILFSVNAAPTSDCYQHQAMIVTELSGIFSSVLTEKDNVGSLECPWRIQAPEGKYGAEL